ncbi:MAG: hypothetical protein ABIK18_03900 [candidate division WOR-3 bacterium]
MVSAKEYKNWIKAIVDQVPCETYERVKDFILASPEAKNSPPKPEITVENHWFCIRRYHDPVAVEDLLEIYIGAREYGPEEWMGYTRIDPRWLDSEGRDMHRWELTRAYLRPQFRGRNYSPYMVDLTLALCKKNRGYSVVAYPRHVAMLVTLLRMGFKTLEGSYDATLRRILNQGMLLYKQDTNQRRLYYAQEFRPFIQDGSFIMEKRVAPPTFWEFIWGKV